ncbi:hypothetical protein SISSUDRAFT_926525 [Sistotremastrum suecicum HHB10207 ss-3]|uniref:Cell morphogenesis protein n=1 Tax=Sistotremastrum suecicum HHB10207 ss-3 TaxID=1314776 RepID=A0A166BTN4_9AGAM|nr:hypothetical protein SISSUDRAFT_926525 [Sistotremastrum suecicum HHB10207 ss-3]
MSDDGHPTITIPTLDFDDDLHNTPTPFGRQNNQAFGHFDDSPSGTPTIERTERVFFHAREDSGNSIDSDRSFHFGTPSSSRGFTNAHSSQSSIASAAPTKKSSFASLKNAFKSSGKSDAAVPPVPPLDPQSHAIRNPFSRSTSSLAHATPTGVSARRPSVTASPPLRPSTPSRPVKRPSRSGSVVNYSDTGSEVGHPNNRFFTPPPVPKVPTGIGRLRSSSQQTQDEKSVEPKTPAEFALHAVFMRFVTAAELKIESFVKQSQDKEPYLPDFLGPGVDANFDELLDSFPRIAQNHSQALVTSIMRWPKTINTTFTAEPLGEVTGTPGRSLTRSQDTGTVLSERKSLAAIYIMCRALIVVLRSMPKDALGGMIGNHLEETIFEKFRKPNLKLLQISANHRANAELFGTLLGYTSNLRFDSVTDRFLAQLKPVMDGMVPKDADPKYESLVKGLRHVQLKVWPPESFEEGTEYLERFARTFCGAHGQRLKTAFAETLTHQLHPIGKTAQAEVNHPVWAKAIDMIFLKSKDMMTKRGYWNVAYPLAVTTLCVAPHEYFLRHWIWCIEAGVPKLKEKTHRTLVMNSMIRLFWTYLFRSREPGSTVISKLDSLLKHFFPLGRLNVIPNEDSVDSLACIVHFVLNQQFEYGRDLCMGLMQETFFKDLGQNPISLDAIPAERIGIAIKAILLSLTCLEKEQPVPRWPSSTTFSVYDLDEDYTFTAEPLPEAFFSKPGIQDFFDRCGPLVASIASLCFQAAGRMSIFDEKWAAPRAPVFEEQDTLVIRSGPEGRFAYPRNLLPVVDLLRRCFDSWPRCLHSSMSLGEALDMLNRGVMHVDPMVSESATRALHRLVQVPSHGAHLVSAYTRFFFSPTQIGKEGTGVRLPIENPRLVNLWSALVSVWLKGFDAQARQSDYTPGKDILGLLTRLEGAALFLLSSIIPSLRAVGLLVLKNVAAVPRVTTSDIEGSSKRIFDLFGQTKAAADIFAKLSPKLDGQFKQRIELLRSMRDDALSSLASSTQDTDQALWNSVYPLFIRSSVEHQHSAATICREAMQSAVLRYHSVISSIAEISSKGPLVQTARSPAQSRDDRDLADYMPLIYQWQLWARVLCASAVTTDSRPPIIRDRDHARIPSDLSSNRERISSARGLFRHIIPFLSSEHNAFREAAVTSLGSIHPSAYQALLQDLQGITRHIFDEFRGKSPHKAHGPRSRRQDRLYTAVAHIYQLTSPFVKLSVDSGDTDSLRLVLQFVRETRQFLSNPDLRSDSELQSLRRHFCGVIQSLFDGLTRIRDSDRFMPSNVRLQLYRLCEEWCRIGYISDTAKARNMAMQSSALQGWPDQLHKERALELFELESSSLSDAAACAMAALTEGAFFGDTQTTSPGAEAIAALQVSQVLERLQAMLGSKNSQVAAGARNALRALLTHHTLNEELINGAFSAAVDMEGSSTHSQFFTVVAELINDPHSKHHFTFGQSVYLGLLNLGSSSVRTRREAFRMVETVHARHSGFISLIQFEPGIGSPAPNIYLYAQKQITDVMANEHPPQTLSLLSQASAGLSTLSGSNRFLQAALLVLGPWISNIDLMPEGLSKISFEGEQCLQNMVMLTARFMDSHPEEMQDLWARLVDDQYPMNSTSTISFLMGQAIRRADSTFMRCATRVIAFLSRTPIGRRAFEDLCSFVEPQHMIATVVTDAISDNELSHKWDLELRKVLPMEDPVHPLAPAQLAWMFLGDVCLERAWDLRDQLPVLLHALFTHSDYRIPFIQHQARRMLLQLLRTWIPGYDELQAKTSLRNREQLERILNGLEKDEDQTFWADSEDEMKVLTKMKQLSNVFITLLEPLHPTLRRDWSEQALHWGTSCSIRPIAYRSLQLFRALMVDAGDANLALLLGRLSNTISDPDINVQRFAKEILLTLLELARQSDLDVALLPQFFWCAAACLSTTVESEYLYVLELVQCLLDRLDLDDLSTIDSLLAQRPNTWHGGEFSLQALILSGLRSSVTYQKSFELLGSLCKVECAELVEPRGVRVRDLYTACLPGCLRAMDEAGPSPQLISLANDLSRLAEIESLSNISRIMTSFAKSRFRTKDDFARQAISALRDNFASRNWHEVVALLLGMVQNKETWLRHKSMQILKVLFQYREAKNPHDPLSSELLMPLLRLLQTDLAPQALDVLDTQMPMSDRVGPSAQAVLRMSLHGELPDIDEPELVHSIPEESGWSVINPTETRRICRNNVMGVYDTCKMASRISEIHFEPDLDADSDSMSSVGETENKSLGDLVSTLHDLGSFFQSDIGALPDRLPPPSKEAEARVAQILARSLSHDSADEFPGIPPTPFADGNIQSPGSSRRPSFDSPVIESDNDSSESDPGDSFPLERFAPSPASRSRMPVIPSLKLFTNGRRIPS